MITKLPDHLDLKSVQSKVNKYISEDTVVYEMNHKLVRPIIEKINVSDINKERVKFTKELMPQKEDVYNSVQDTISTIDFIQGVRTEQGVTEQIRKLKRGNPQKKRANKSQEELIDQNDEEFIDRLRDFENEASFENIEDYSNFQRKDVVDGMIK